MRRTILYATLASLVALSASAADLAEADQALSHGDSAAAIDILGPLAQGGELEAMLRLAALYQAGDGVGRDLAKAVEYYKRAAELGNAEAQFNLGNLYLMGEGVPQDDGWALTFYRLAAKQGHKLADRNMRELYRAAGLPAPPLDDVDGAERRVPATNARLTTGSAASETAAPPLPAISGSATQVPLDNGASASGNGAAAAAQTSAQPGAAGGEPDVIAVSEDEAKAIQLARQHGIKVELDGPVVVVSAPAPSPGDQTPPSSPGMADTAPRGTQQTSKATTPEPDAGTVRPDGKGAAQVDPRAHGGDGDPTGKTLAAARQALANGRLQDAFLQFEALAQTGDAAAQYELSRLLDSGHGGARVPGAAVTWLQRSAEQGYADAQYELGERYRTGTGVAPDDAMAITLFREAAAEGHRPARERLLQIYRDAGLPPPDLSKPRKPAAGGPIEPSKKPRAEAGPRTSAPVVTAIEDVQVQMEPLEPMDGSDGAPSTRHRDATAAPAPVPSAAATPMFAGAASGTVTEPGPDTAAAPENIVNASVEGVFVTPAAGAGHKQVAADSNETLSGDTGPALASDRLAGIAVEPTAGSPPNQGAPNSSEFGVSRKTVANDEIGTTYTEMVPAAEREGVALVVTEDAQDAASSAASPAGIPVAIEARGASGVLARIAGWFSRVPENVAPAAGGHAGDAAARAANGPSPGIHAEEAHASSAIRSETSMAVAGADQGSETDAIDRSGDVGGQTDTTNAESAELALEHGSDYPGAALVAVNALDTAREDTGVQSTEDENYAGTDTAADGEVHEELADSESPAEDTMAGAVGAEDREAAGVRGQDWSLEEGREAIARRDFARAAEIFRALAEAGDAEAQAHIGYMLYKGEGAPRDRAQAVDWYRRAAVQGNRDAQYNLAVAYAFGEGVVQDDGEAVIWYQRAADQGSAIAQYSLGVSYALGEGVPQDDAMAVRWYRAAAKQGYAAAQYGLAYCYRTGKGVDHDDAEALGWFASAAANGHAAAQYSLGYMYRSGKGVVRDIEEAVKWYRLAASQGHPEARADLASLVSGAP